MSFSLSLERVGGACGSRRLGRISDLGKALLCKSSDVAIVPNVRLTHKSTLSGSKFVWLGGRFILSIILKYQDQL